MVPDQPHAHHRIPVCSRHGNPVIVTAKVLTAKERKRLEKSAQSVISKNAHSRTELLDLIGEHVSLLLDPNDN